MASHHSSDHSILSSLSGGCCGWALLLRSAVRNACDIYKLGLCRPAFFARFLQWNWKTTATEYRRRQADSFRSTFQNLHRILRVAGSFPRGSAERVRVWFRDDDVLDAWQRDPLACVRRIYMRLEIALTQLWGCFTMLAFIRVVVKESTSKSLYRTSRHYTQFFAWPQPWSRVRRHLHVVVSRAQGVPVVVRRKT